jgi:dolichyl-phosphate beta-glucosyltransferase
MDLSIIIPVYNEQEKISRDIEQASQFLEKERMSGEIIVVDDGSRDDTASAAHKTAVPQNISKKVISYDKNRGKGYAVRNGMMISEGDYVMFADSGSCIDYDFALKGLALLKGNQCDIAHASRKLTQSVIARKQSFSRQVTSKLFGMLMTRFMNVPGYLTDTQCGFKMYKGYVARDIYRNTVAEGFAFDLEIILRAVKKKYRIEEFPVEWVCDRDTRLAPMRISLNVINECMKIKRSL